MANNPRKRARQDMNWRAGPRPSKKRTRTKREPPPWINPYEWRLKRLQAMKGEK